VHEVFATTISSGAVGVLEARGMLEGNNEYLGYLEAGLQLGGYGGWPWQFRESAVQMVLRSLMPPRELLAIAELVLSAFDCETPHPCRCPPTAA
jgi:hypothetical protein